MTPADAQSAANQFHDAYRAITAGPIVLNGAPVCVPRSEATTAVPVGSGNCMTILAAHTKVSGAAGALQTLARRVAEHLAGRSHALFFRLPGDPALPSMTSDVERLPCRATLVGPLRDELMLEVGVGT